MSEEASRVDDEDGLDFMSDEFIKDCTKNDVRPGLLFKSSDKRKHEQLKRKDEANGMKLSQAQKEEVNRETGLSTAIGADNVGFKMMERMGFKPGENIGKRAGSIMEPIPIQIKRGRGCLGQQSVLEEKKKKKEALGDVDSFRARLQKSSAATQIKLDLERARRICQILDSDSGIQEPVEDWYWPPKPKIKSSEVNGEEFHDSDEEEASEADEAVPNQIDQLEAVVNHLRLTHFYCIWCGATFSDKEDLEKSCPGLNREDH